MSVHYFVGVLAENVAAANASIHARGLGPDPANPGRYPLPFDIAARPLIAADDPDDAPARSTWTGFSADEWPLVEFCLATDEIAYRAVEGSASVTDAWRAAVLAAQGLREKPSVAP